MKIVLAQIINFAFNLLYFSRIYFSFRIGNSSKSPLTNRYDLISNIYIRFANYCLWLESICATFNILASFKIYDDRSSEKMFNLYKLWSLHIFVEINDWLPGRKWNVVLIKGEHLLGYSFVFSLKCGSCIRCLSSRFNRKPKQWQHKNTETRSIIHLGKQTEAAIQSSVRLKNFLSLYWKAVWTILSKNVHNWELIKGMIQMSFTLAPAPENLCPVCSFLNRT